MDEQVTIVEEYETGFLSLPQDSIRNISERLDDSSRIAFWMTCKHARLGITLPENMKKPEITAYAVRDGNMAILEWLRKSYPFGIEAARAAGRSKNPLMINYVRKINRLVPALFEGSAEVGDIETLKVLECSVKSRISKEIIYHGLKSESNEVLDFLYGLYKEIICEKHWIRAARCKTDVSLKWLHSKMNGQEVPDVWVYVIIDGNIDILKAYMAMKTLTSAALELVCERADREQFDEIFPKLLKESRVLNTALSKIRDDEFRRYVVNAFISNGCPWNEDCVQRIFQSKDKILIEAVIDFSSGNMLCFAAMSGHLDILKRVYETGKYPLKEDIMEEAAANGDIDMIEYLIEQKCPCLHRMAAVNAVSRRRLDIMKALIAYNGVFPDNISSPLTKDDEELLLFLFQNPSFRIRAYHQSKLAAQGNIDVLKILKGKVKWSKSVIPAACKKGQIQTVIWCIENDVPISLVGRGEISRVLGTHHRESETIQRLKALMEEKQ